MPEKQPAQSPPRLYRKVSIVVPVYNERQTIADVLEIVGKATTCGLEKEVILVDDCSNDGTREFLSSYSSPGTKIILRQKNGGKGAALKTGFQEAVGDIIIIQDADLEYDPEEYERLIRPFLENAAEVVYGSRYLKSGLRQVPRFWHTLMNKLFTLLSNMLTDIYLTDVQTCYKVMSRKVMLEVRPKLQSPGFGFDPEITAKIARGGYKIMEVPVSYYPRSRQAGKHMNLKAQLDALAALLKYNLFT